ncbi:MAG: hypothetical protein AB1498_11020 [bacterium]
MRKTNKFIFICMISVSLGISFFFKNISAVHEEASHEKNIGHNPDGTIHDAANIKDGGKTAGDMEGSAEHGEIHTSSHIWPHYGKMLIFAKILLAFMLFSFIAPLAHYYIKGEKHH